MAKSKKPRRVATPEGAQFYGLPVGTVISADVIEKKDAGAAAIGIAPPKNGLASVTEGTKKKNLAVVSTPAVIPSTLKGPIRFNVGGKEFTAPKGAKLYRFKGNKDSMYVHVDGQIHSFSPEGEVELEGGVRALFEAAFDSYGNAIDARFTLEEPDGEDEVPTQLSELPVGSKLKNADGEVLFEKIGPKKWNHVDLDAEMDEKNLQPLVDSGELVADEPAEDEKIFDFSKASHVEAEAAMDAKKSGAVIHLDAGKEILVFTKNDKGTWTDLKGLDRDSKALSVLAFKLVDGPPPAEKPGEVEEPTDPNVVPDLAIPAESLEDLVPGAMVWERFSDGTVLGFEVVDSDTVRDSDPKMGHDWSNSILARALAEGRLFVLPKEGPKAPEKKTDPEPKPETKEPTTEFTWDVVGTDVESVEQLDSLPTGTVMAFRPGRGFKGDRYKKLAGGSWETIGVMDGKSDAARLNDAVHFKYSISAQKLYIELIPGVEPPAIDTSPELGDDLDSPVKLANLPSGAIVRVQKGQKVALFKYLGGNVWEGLAPPGDRVHTSVLTPDADRIQLVGVNGKVEVARELKDGDFISDIQELEDLLPDSEIEWLTMDKLTSSTFRKSWAGKWVNAAWETREADAFRNTVRAGMLRVNTVAQPYVPEKPTIGGLPRKAVDLDSYPEGTELTVRTVGFEMTYRRVGTGWDETPETERSRKAIPSTEFANAISEKSAVITSVPGQEHEKPAPEPETEQPRDPNHQTRLARVGDTIINDEELKDLPAGTEFKWMSEGTHMTDYRKLANGNFQTRAAKEFDETQPWSEVEVTTDKFSFLFDLEGSTLEITKVPGTDPEPLPTPPQPTGDPAEEISLNDDLTATRGEIEEALRALETHPSFQISYAFKAIPENPLASELPLLTELAAAEYPGVAVKAAVMNVLRDRLGIARNRTDGPKARIGSETPKSTAGGMTGGEYSAEDIREAIEILEGFDGKVFKSALTQRGNPLGELSPREVVPFDKDKAVMKKAFIDLLRSELTKLDFQNPPQPPPIPDSAPVPEPEAPEVPEGPRDPNVPSQPGDEILTKAQADAVPVGTEVRIYGFGIGGYALFTKGADGIWVQSHIGGDRALREIPFDRSQPAVVERAAPKVPEMEAGYVLDNDADFRILDTLPTGTWLNQIDKDGTPTLQFYKQGDGRWVSGGADYPSEHVMTSRFASTAVRIKSIGEGLPEVTPVDELPEWDLGYEILSEKERNARGTIEPEFEWDNDNPFPPEGFFKVGKKYKDPSMYRALPEGSVVSSKRGGSDFYLKGHQGWIDAEGNAVSQEKFLRSGLFVLVLPEQKIDGDPVDLDNVYTYPMGTILVSRSDPSRQFVRAQGVDTWDQSNAGAKASARRAGYFSDELRAGDFIVIDNDPTKYLGKTIHPAVLLTIPVGGTVEFDVDGEPHTYIKNTYSWSSLTGGPSDTRSVKGPFVYGMAAQGRVRFTGMEPVSSMTSIEAINAIRNAKNYDEMEIAFKRRFPRIETDGFKEHHGWARERDEAVKTNARGFMSELVILFDEYPVLQRIKKVGIGKGDGSSMAWVSHARGGGDFKHDDAITEGSIYLNASFTEDAHTTVRNAITSNWFHSHSGVDGYAYIATHEVGHLMDLATNGQIRERVQSILEQLAMERGIPLAGPEWERFLLSQLSGYARDPRAANNGNAYAEHVSEAFAAVRTSPLTATAAERAIVEELFRLIAEVEAIRVPKLSTHA